MSTDINIHQSRIERPGGRPGYRPKYWCSVCGKAAKLEVDQACIIDNCRNICHIGCLGEYEVFNCENTSQLRELHGIPHHITYYIDRPDTPAAPVNVEDQDLQDEDSQDELNQLQKEELVVVVKQLRKELSTTKTKLMRYKTIVDELPEKRNILVNAIAIIDSLVATQASIEEVQQRTIASSAYPDRIDQDWEKHIEEHDEVYTWWSAEQTKKGKKTKERKNNLRQPPHPPRQKSPLPPQHRDHPLRRQSPPPQQHQDQYNKQQPRGSYQHQREKQTSQSYQRNQTQDSRKQPYTSHWVKRDYQQQGYTDQTAHVNLVQKAYDRRQTYTGSQRYFSGANKCIECHRQGHTSEKCPKFMYCDYCNRRYHTTQNCRERIADQRQQELVNAVKQNTQETLAAVRTFQASHTASGQHQFTPTQHTGRQDYHNFIQPYFGTVPYYLTQHKNVYQQADPAAQASNQ